MNALLKAVSRHAFALHYAQKVVLDAEVGLLTAVQEYLDGSGFGIRELSRRLGFSAQYVCDIRHGRRKISAEFLERLKRLEAE
jgi:transcriptional regulator with XRE-family HTH domain